MKIFVKFILTATVDGLSVLDAMISRISHESQVLTENDSELV